MTFAEKLDLLMKITNTSNIVLARTIAVDASFISRLRRGDRTPARNVTYLQAMAEYFARNCRAEYQRTALWNAIINSSQIRPSETDSLKSLELMIYKWLNEKESPAADSINAFLNGIVNFQFKKKEPAAVAEIDNTPYHTASEFEVFYGVKGKQTAVLTFLSLVLKNKNPQTLLLYSDEDMGWLTVDQEFTAQWASLLLQFLKSGNRIKIIHSINRNFDEMLRGIKEWVPLYMTGAIEPYYYPKNRDGLFHQTLFIAPDTPAAVTSSSVGSGTQNAANFLFTNNETVKALSEEYNNFLHLCRPLMHISTPFNIKEYLSLLAEFEDEKTKTILKADGLTNITMPLSVMNSIMTRLEIPEKEQLLSCHQKRTEKFFEHIQKFNFTVICSLPDPEQILNGEVAVNFSDTLSETQLFYTPDEYRQHLLGIIHLLENYDNFSLYLTNDKHMEGVIVYVREDVGVLVIKTLMPSVVFAINESNMTAAFWDYFHVFLNKESKSTIIRNHALAKIKKIVYKLEEMSSSENH
jgi:hypothetical protein